MDGALLLNKGKPLGTRLVRPFLNNNNNNNNFSNNNKLEDDDEKEEEEENIDFLTHLY